MNGLEAIGHHGLPCTTLSTQFDPAASLEGLEKALDRLCAAASTAVEAGSQILVLSDRHGLAGAPAHPAATAASLPPLLAVGAVHHHLLRAGQRLRCSLVVDTAQCWSTHHLACLIGYGASAVCPWLT
jgi:Glutamate synthase central domain.